MANNQTRTQEPDLSFQISEDWTTSRHNDIQLWSKTTKCLALKIDGFDDTTQVLKLKYKIESLPSPALQVICNWFCDSPIISNIPPLRLIIQEDIHTVSHHTNVYLWSCGDWKIILSYKVHIHCRQMWKSSVTEWCPNDDHHGHPMMSKWSPCSCRVDWLLVTKCGFTCDSSCPTFPLLLKYTFWIDIFEMLFFYIHFDICWYTLVHIFFIQRTTNAFMDQETPLSFLDL